MTPTPITFTRPNDLSVGKQNENNASDDKTENGKIIFKI